MHTPPRSLRRAACALVATLLLPLASTAACRVERRAAAPITLAGGLPLVPLTINGTTTAVVLDTGAERSVIGEAAAKRLLIARDEWVSTDILGTGGRDRQRLGRPASLTLGGIALRRHTVAADNSVVIGPIVDQVGGQPVAGLLGQDFLSAFDLDIDIAGRTLTLYTVTGCSGRFLPAPWDSAEAITAWRPVRNVLAVPIQIGATPLQAELDSGAAITVITLPGMVRLGLLPGGPDNAQGFGRGQLAARTQRFTLRVGTAPAAPAELAIAPVPTLRSIGALLGADWLAAHHVWVSWATNQVFVAGT